MRTALGMNVVTAALVLCLVAPARTQVPEYDFYAGFRAWMMSLPIEQRRMGVLEDYRKRLAAEGVPAAEIERRLGLIKTRREALEADFWNRFFTAEKGIFNEAPNEFLVSVVQNRKPGRALDVGMGEGRNTLYLAKLGWDVTGFDPADNAVAGLKPGKGLRILRYEDIPAVADYFDREQMDVLRMVAVKEGR